MATQELNAMPYSTLLDMYRAEVIENKELRRIMIDLQRDSDFLDCLERLGLDDLEIYEDAHTLYEELYSDDLVD